MTASELKTLQLVSVRWWNASVYYGISLCDALNRAGIPSIAGGRIDSPPLRKAREVFSLPTFTEINLESLKPQLALRNLRALRRYVREARITLINAHRPEDHSFGALLRQFSSTPLPLVRTVSDVRSPRDHRLNRLLHDRGTDFYIFSCKASYERYQAVWPIFEGRSAVIYSALNTDFYHPLQEPSPLRLKLGIKPEEVLVGVIARLDPVKDHASFLRAAAQALETAPRARFLISGEDCNVTREELQVLAGELGILERVIFLDRDDGLDHRELIGALDVGVVSSNGSEVICRIAVEYMALGIPVVSTDINVLPEIVEHGRSGFVGGAGDHQAMARHITTLVNNAELRKKMGQTARRDAEARFSYPALVEQTLVAYRRAEEIVRKGRDKG